MSRDTTVIAFRQPEAIDDPLSELAREGARRILAQVLIAEADSFVAMWKDLKLPDGRDRIVRHGHGPHRAIQTGVGPVEVRRAKVRDRGDVGAEEKIRFTSSILPRWARRTKSLDALLPVLYLRGVSTGDFQEVLTALLGKDAPNLSPAVIARLTAEWQVDYDAWQKRDLSARRYVYVWADGVYLQARMEEAAECMLVLIAEADAFVAQWKDLKLPDGRDRVVRHGHGPQRAIQTGVGPIEVRRAKVRDRADVAADEKIRFTSSILPKWARRTKSLDALLPILYLRGVSTGDFQEALAALLGKDAPNLSPAVIARLTAEWQTEYDAWQKRELSARRYVYEWADGVYLQARI